MTTSEDLSLPSLFNRALVALSQSTQVPAIDPASQNRLRAAAADLELLSSRVAALSLFSTNESVEDLSTRDAAYLLVDFVYAEVEVRLRTDNREQRMSKLRRAQTFLTKFTHRLDDYGIIHDSDKELFATNGGSDPASRRELKIKQYKAEKEIRSRIEALLSSLSPTSDFDLYASLLAPTATSSPSSSASNRQLTFLLLRLAHFQTQIQLKSIFDELELLRSAPPESQREITTTDQQDSDVSWRLDNMRRDLTAKGPILDPSGKPLRPFTILPSSRAGGVNDRQRLAEQVFRPDHRLPTMTIDEYLAEEQRRGNILTGGGAASQNAPTSTEVLTEESEQDGTIFGDIRAEDKRKKDEEWALYTEANPRGAGNRMNKG